MEVTPGLIPDGWEAKTLGDVCGRITTGKLDANAMVANGDYPFFTCASENYWIDKYAFDCEALLVSGNGANVGYVHYYNGKFNAYQRTYVISEFSADVQFIKLFLDRNLQQRIRTEVNAGNTPYIKMGTLTEMRVILPCSQFEQRAIAGALSDVDELIGGLDQLITKKHDLKQATMQQLLTGQTRLPGFHGEWEVRSLHEVCQKIQDGTHFSPKLGGNDYLYVTSKNIGFGKFDVSTADRIDATEHAKIYARCDVKKGDLLLTKDGANTGNAALNPLDEPFSLLSSVALLRFDCRRHLPAYFMYQILSFEGQRQIKDLMSGNAITRVTLVKIRSLRFSIASFEEQTAIASVLSDMDAELAALEQRRDKTFTLKQGMMQELLTGRTRLV